MEYIFKTISLTFFTRKINWSGPQKDQQFSDKTKCIILLFPIPQHIWKNPLTREELEKQTGLMVRKNYHNHEQNNCVGKCAAIKHKIITIIPTECLSVPLLPLSMMENGKIQTYARFKCFVDIPQGGEGQTMYRMTFFGTLSSTDQSRTLSKGYFSLL